MRGGVGLLPCIVSQLLLIKRLHLCIYMYVHSMRVKVESGKA